MKKDLLTKVRSIPNLESAWRTIQENGRTSSSEDVKSELAVFNEDAPSKLRSLNHRLARNRFKFAPAKGVPIPKLDSKGKKTGKVRPIVLAPVESRIVQRALLNILVEIPDLKKYVKTEFSFGGIRADKPKVKKDGSKIPRAERLSAVPAAVKAVLKAIEDGALFVATADLQSFFTKIPKKPLSDIVLEASGDVKFTAFFDEAIRVELANLDSLKKLGAEWPIEEIGVAQGSSLSPLLGNMILANFDKEMNDGDCRCIRYVDDFIILAPTQKAATARLRKAQTLLASIGMTLSPEKSSKGGMSIHNGFDFLGINFCPGAVRPGAKAQAKFLASIDGLMENGKNALIAAKKGESFERTQTLLGTLKKLDGMIDGWGKHYWFCNDEQIWRNLDVKIATRVSQLLGLYSEIRDRSPAELKMSLLGVSEMVRIEREPFVYPKT